MCFTPNQLGDVGVPLMHVRYSYMHIYGVEE